MAFGTQFYNGSTEKVISSDSFNMHYLGQATHFSTQSFQTYPATQYDNFFIASEYPVMPFIVNRPGYRSAILSVRFNGSAWDIVVLSETTEPSVDDLSGGVYNTEPYLTSSGPGSNPANYNNPVYSFAFNTIAPPTVLCFSRLADASTLAEPTGYGMALYDPSSRLVFDSGRKPLDPYWIGNVSIPSATTHNSLGFSGSPQYGSVFMVISPPLLAFPDGWRALENEWVSGTTTTSVSYPSNPAWFFSSPAEAFSGCTHGPVTNFTLGTNAVPGLTLTGGNASVSWLARASLQLSGPLSAWTRDVGSSPLIVIDADRYL